MANTRKPSNPTLADITARTKPIEKIVELCVAGDLYAEHERLEEELERAQDAALDRVTSRSGKLNTSGDTTDPEVERLAKQIVAVEAKMAKDTYEFRFQKLPGEEWDDLVGAHPPRDGNQGDERRGVNRSTFPKVAVQKSCKSPEGMSDVDVFDQFWAKLNTGQRDDLYGGALAANQVGGSVPKSATASAVIRASKRNSASVSA